LPDKERVVVGIDIGGSKTVVAIGTPEGELLSQARVDHWASGSWERDLQFLAERARAALREVGAERAQAVGVCAPGPLDPVRGIVLDAPNLAGWVSVPLAQSLGTALGAPVRLENDANAAALAEWRHGAGRGTRNMVFATMSTGIGAGLILEGRLYRGSHFLAGELGHVPIRRDGRAHAGLVGTLEAYAGGAALAQRIREDLAAGRSSRITELAGGDPARISARRWVEAIRAGDAYAAELQREFVEDVAQALAMLVMVLDPELIALGTIVQRNPDLFLEAIRARTHERIWPVQRDVRIVAGQLGEQLPARAALCVASLEESAPAR
jgi:glucokinase